MIIKQVQVDDDLGLPLLLYLGELAPRIAALYRANPRNNKLAEMRTSLTRRILDQK